MKQVEAWPVYEFECPNCKKISQLSDCEFDLDWVSDETGERRMANRSVYKCECGEEFEVYYEQ